MELAEENLLTHYSFYRLLEDMADSMELKTLLFDFTPMPLQHVNPSQGTKGKEIENLRDVLYAQSSMDCVLYEAAAEEFDRRGKNVTN